MSWLAFFPHGNLAGLAPMRTDPGLEVAEVGHELVVRFSNPELVREFERCVCRLYREEPDGLGLVEEGDRVPTRRNPEIVRWQSLCEWWKMEWRTPEPHRHPFPVSDLELVRSAEVRPATALRCDLETLVDWVEGAAAVRMDGLLVAVNEEGTAWVEGAILPPISGRRFWSYGADVFLPLGWRLGVELAPVQVRRALAASGGVKLVADRDGCWDSVPSQGLVRLERAGMRATLKASRGAVG